MDRSWIDEYIRLHFPYNPEDLKIEEAIRLKYQNLPESLFRYRTFDGHSVENLRQLMEWMSYPKEFNDPYDAGMKISAEVLKRDLIDTMTIPKMIEAANHRGIEVDAQELTRIHNSDQPIIALSELILEKDPHIAEKAKELAQAVNDAALKVMDEDLNKMRDAFRNGYLVTCFSETKHSILMWSHYSHNHTGFCIEYDLRKLGPLHPRTRLLFPVIYQEEFFDATEYIKVSLMQTATGSHFNNLFGMYPTICKSLEWSYEREWRLVFPLGPGVEPSDAERRLISMPKPKTLYVGAKATPENVELLLGIARELRVPVRQMTMSRQRFQLEEQDLYQP